MIEVHQTDELADWLRRLRDRRARVKIVARIARFADGNPGDVKAVGAGISEMRIHAGAGYRVYFVQRGKAIVLLLCGGDKGSQDRDIVIADRLAREYKD